MVINNKFPIQLNRFQQYLALLVEQEKVLKVREKY